MSLLRANINENTKVVLVLIVKDILFLTETWAIWMSCSPNAHIIHKNLTKLSKFEITQSFNHVTFSILLRLIHSEKLAIKIQPHKNLSYSTPYGKFSIRSSTMETNMLQRRSLESKDECETSISINKVKNVSKRSSEIL
ncbi:hypothetical protein ACJX0J_023929, partial [Zea mays]